jgi:hypothetical protein
MTPEHLIKMNPEEASGQELLMLIALAVDDIKKAINGTLTTADGRKIHPAMGLWGYESKESEVCPACLAGCVVMSRFTPGIINREEFLREYPSAVFLDRCRWIAHEINYSDRAAFNIAIILLKKQGVYIPNLNRRSTYSAYKAENVVEYLEELLRVNNHMLTGKTAQHYSPVRQLLNLLGR